MFYNKKIVNTISKSKFHFMFKTSIVKYEFSKYDTTLLFIKIDRKSKNKNSGIRTEYHKQTAITKLST